MTRGKLITDAYKNIRIDKPYSIKEAVEVLLKNKRKKFDETVEISMNLGIDPRHADQMVRGSLSLPNGIGKKVKVAVFAKDKQAEEAIAQGADIVGSEDLAKKIEDGDTNYDRVIASPDMMGIVGKIAKVLGPKGLMPNPKLGTVSEDIVSTVDKVKNKFSEVKNDKDGNIGISIGRKNYTDKKLLENFKSLFETLKKDKPSMFNSEIVKNIYISPTMGPSLKISFKDI